MTTTPTPKLFMWSGKDAGKNTGKIIAGMEYKFKFTKNTTVIQQQDAIYGVFYVPSHYGIFVFTKVALFVLRTYEGMD